MSGFLKGSLSEFNALREPVKPMKSSMFSGGTFVGGGGGGTGGFRDGVLEVLGVDVFHLEFRLRGYL